MYNLFKLSNGLRVVIENIDYVNSVSIGLWVKNGSRNESGENNGISHFIEHMLFKGTYNRSAKQIAEEIEDVGGQINAFTGKEATCYYVKVLDSHINLALNLLADMLFNSKFSDEDIEKEKGVVIEEINMSEDSPEDVLNDVHSKAIWGNDSLSLPILGTHDSVRSFSRKQIIDYVSSYYIPDNCVISVSGKFDLNTIEKAIESYFGKWECKNKNITKYPQTVIQKLNLFKKKNIEQLHISLGIPGFETGNEELYPLLVLNNVFGGGASSILFQSIREEMGLCYSVYSYLSSFDNTGVLTIYAGLNSSFAAKAVESITKELDKFVKKGISSDKLTKAKEQLKGSYILGLESTSSRMFSNGRAALFLNRINTPQDIIAKINKIEIDKLNDVMQKTFALGIQNSAFVGENVDENMVRNLVEGDIVAFKNQTSKRV